MNSASNTTQKLTTQTRFTLELLQKSNKLGIFPDYVEWIQLLPPSCIWLTIVCEEATMEQIVRSALSSYSQNVSLKSLSVFDVINPRSVGKCSTSCRLTSTNVLCLFKPEVKHFVKVRRFWIVYLTWFASDKWHDTRAAHSLSQLNDLPLLAWTQSSTWVVQIKLYWLLLIDFGRILQK